MKVILLEDVKGLGKVGDVVEVKPGYANNALFRQNKAMEATPANMNILKTKQKAEAAKAQHRLEEAKAMAAALKDKVIKVKMKAGEGGRLYGALTNQQLAELLAEAGFEVDKRGVTFPEPIKNLGEHVADLKLHPEVSVRIRLDIGPLA